MSASPTSIQHAQLILQAFEESLSFWCQLRDDVEAHFNNEKRLTGNDGVEVLDVPRHVHRKMTEHLSNQQQRIKTIASSGQFVIYVQAQYALVALVDDQLLRMVKWPHQNEWLTMLLEKTMFSSRNAGHKLIQRVEELVENDAVGKTVSPQIKQLAYIYVCVFWQGFKGKLFNNPGKIEHFVNALTEISDFGAVDLSHKHLFHQPYLHNKNNDKAGRLAPISKWHRVTLIAFILYIVASTGVWSFLTMELSQELEAVTSMTTSSK